MNTNNFWMEKVPMVAFYMLAIFVFAGWLEGYLG
jgi:hypothetical protein